jgi:hypothetical protein
LTSHNERTTQAEGITGIGFCGRYWGWGKEHSWEMEKNTCEALGLVVLVKFDHGDKTKDKMGGPCCTHQRDNKCVHNLVGKPQGTTPL